VGAMVEGALHFEKTRFCALAVKNFVICNSAKIQAFE
jgi:hypothetical protein